MSVARDTAESSASQVEEEIGARSAQASIPKQSESAEHVLVDDGDGLRQPAAAAGSTASPLPPTPHFDALPLGGGEGGEGGGDAPGDAGRPEVTNAEFVAAIFTSVGEGTSAAVCSKPGDPAEGGWQAMPASRAAEYCLPTNNNYLTCSSFRFETDGSVKARKASFAACHAVMLDDIGTKVPMERLAGLEPSWLIETSPGNHQAGFILDPPLADAAEADRLLDASSAAGLCDPGSKSPTSRWVRLPVGINGKPKYEDDEERPFRVRLKALNPHNRFTPAQLRAALGLQPEPATESSSQPSVSDDDVFTSQAADNPVLTALKDRNLYKAPLGPGKHDVTCPWAHEHTDGLDTGAAYFEPDEQFPLGGFCCQHSHRDRYHIGELLEELGVSQTAARNKAVIRVLAGDMSRVVNAAERELARRGRHYQYGGLIVSISTDPVSGDPAIVPISLPALTRELAQIVRWEKHDGRALAFVACDPPQRHVAILHDAQRFAHLPALAGLTRQPYFRESDGELVMTPGYDPASQRYGVFDPRDFALPEPTRDAALVALARLEALLAEFHFVTSADRAAALAAIFTAVVRPSLDFAPGFHVRAPVFASGKTFLCDLIGAFAGPGGNLKVSYPTTSEEATKVLLSLLLTGPAVIEFDDMDTDWIPHGIIKRMLTAAKVTERILGLSKTATVSTRTLFLGSGNNVGPVRDLLRRVLTIHVDPRCATPATLRYRSNPVETVRKDRARYVADVLTIIQAWRKAGSPRADADNIVTFNGAWSDLCRYPLMWLGQPDPATALLQQVRHDPDADALATLMKAWKDAFGSAPTTVRRAVEAAQHGHPDLLDAMQEFPIIERGEINRSKLGWLLKKNADRIVGGLVFQKTEADGRTAWRVAPASPPPFRPAPPSPPLPGSSATAGEQAQGGA